MSAELFTDTLVANHWNQSQQKTLFSRNHASTAGEISPLSS